MQVRFALRWTEQGGTPTGFRLTFYPSLPVNLHGTLAAMLRERFGQTVLQRGNAGAGEVFTYALSTQMFIGQRGKQELGHELRKLMARLGVVEQTN